MENNLSDIDIAQIRGNRICSTCVQEEFLSQEILRTGELEDCDYCQHEGITWTVEDLACEVGNVINEHFRISNFDIDPLTGREPFVPEGAPAVSVISELLETDEEQPLVEEIRLILEEDHSDEFVDWELSGEGRPFCEEAYYVGKRLDTREWHQGWQRYEELLRNESRFFSREALNILSNIFSDIHLSRSHGGEAVVQEVASDEIPALYRARAFQSVNELEDAMKRPDLHLGPPPGHKAKAGRMNAEGISVFYGATDPRIAVSEVRPPVGSQVLVGRFNIEKPLKLLNLVALENLEFQEGSLFDTKHIKRVERGGFLRSLGKLMARPVMPNDETFDYLPTQAVADYLSGLKSPTDIDGIVFQSVQSSEDGYNVVLFHKAAKVKLLSFPEGCELRALASHWREDGDTAPLYQVSETITVNPQSDPRPAKSAPMEFPSMPESIRSNTISVDLDSLKVYQVKAAEYTCDTTEVSRHRFKCDETGQGILTNARDFDL